MQSLTGGEAPLRDGSPAVVTLSSAEIPERERVSVVCEAYAQTIVRHRLEPLASDPFSFRAEFHRFPGLGIAFMESSGVRGICLDADGGDDVFVNLTLAGGRNVVQKGRDVTLGIGEALVSLSAPGVCTVHPGSRWISLRTPRRSLA